MGRLNQRVYSVWIMSLLLLFLAACGGDSDENQVLPTRVIIGGDDVAETTPDTTEAPVDDSVAPTPTAEAPSEDDEPPVTPTDAQEATNSDDNAPPPPPPPGTGNTAPTPDNQQQSADNLPPGATTNNPPPPGPVTSNAITDFSTLAVGDNVVLLGVISVVTVDETPVTLITGENGTVLEVNAPPGMLEGMTDQQFQLSGTVEAASGDTDATLAITPSTLSALNPDAMPGVPTTGDDEGEGGALVPGGDGTLPFPSAIGGSGETLETQLEPGMTGLQTYDALLPVIEADVEALLWTRLSGSAESGWVFEFFDPEAVTVTRYTVSSEGDILRAAPTAAPDLPGIETLAIDRSLVVVDSDAIIAQLNTDAAITPFGSPLLSLTVNQEGRIEWILQGPEPESFDATTPTE